MLQYLIKFSISLAVLYIFYRAVLRPLTFYQCNRFYLLCYSLLSFVIPCINITPWVSGQNNHQLVKIIPVIGNYYVVTNPNAAGQSSLFRSLTAADWLIIVFCAGAAVMLVKLIIQYFSLRRIRQNAVLLNTGGGVQLYETTAPVSPFSFGNAIYFNRSLHSQEELQRIIQHEFVHVKQKHTIDLLTGELLCVVNWFNPFAWLIRSSMRQNLEFIADNNVMANGLNKKEYQYLLLKVVGVPQYSIAGNFNFSNLKKRIAMMNKMKTPKLHLTKFLFVLPLLAVLFLAFRKNENEKKEKIFTTIANSQVTDTAPLPPPPPPAIGIHKAPVANKNGYIITVADNNGECVVLVKDQQRKIIKAITLEEWNKNQKENEKQYGEIPPPPPPPPPPPAHGPTPVELPETPAEPPMPPARVKLPADVKGISINTNVNNQTNSNTATVTLKNGTKEVYNLNDPKEKAAYIKKYGELPAPPPPPGPPVPAKAPNIVSIAAVEPAVAIQANAAVHPLYVVDGIEKTDMVNINAIRADKIESVHVLKDKYATDKYGDKAKAGAVEINMKKNQDDHFPKDVLVIIDGKEIPAGSKTDDYVKPADIESMNVLKDKAATDKYGEKGKRGVIEIKTKKAGRSYQQKSDTLTLTADTITGIKQHFRITGGTVLVNGKEATVIGNISFDNMSELPLIIYNGKEISNIGSFKVAKAKYRLITLEEKEAVAKYGTKAKYGALEINSL